MTQIHHFSSTTGEYSHSTTARTDPLGGGPLVPANATLVAPLADVADDHVVCFVGGEWVALVDNRGALYWLADGTEVRISKLGADVLEGALLEAPDLRSEAEKSAAFIADVVTFVGARITGQASLNTQLNMAAMAGGGLFDDGQLAAYRSGLIWIKETREMGKSMIANAVVDYEDESLWPVVPASTAALAKLF